MVVLPLQKAFSKVVVSDATCTPYLFKCFIFFEHVVRTVFKLSTFPEIIVFYVLYLLFVAYMYNKWF